jgi:hypothetical protein
MASTYTTGFGIEKIGTGEQAGAWGTTTNHNADILDRIASYKAVALSGTTHTLTVREASPGSGTENLQDGMYRVIKFTGALGANNTVTIAPNTSPAYFIIENATTDSGSSGPYSVILTQGSGANVTVQNGKNAIIYCDGAGAGAVVYDALADLQVGTLEVTGAAAIDGALTAAAITATTLTTSGIASIDDTTDTTSGTTGSIHTDGGLGVAKNLFVATNATVSGTTLMTGVTTHGGNVVSDTDSTDDLGTTGVRWANTWTDAINGVTSPTAQYTSAEETKLAGIEASADVTDATNVLAALVGQEAVATGFTGTLDGVLGGGTPAAATVTTLTASGVTTVQAGTALLPSIVPTGDTNTGVWFPAADTVAASTAGTERMRIDSSGNVGIGTAAPVTPLDVNGITRTVNAYSLSYAGVPGATSAFGAGTISADANWGMYFKSTTGAASAEFAFVNAAGSERMRIDSSGNVGIGTSTAATTLSFPIGTNTVIGQTYTSSHAAGNVGSIGIGINDGGGAASGVYVHNTHDGTYSSQDIRFSTDEGGISATTERMRITGAGNVGIGTTAPAYKLDINGITGWGANQTAPIANIVGANAPTNGGGNLRVLSNTSATADAGGSLVLGGYYTAQTDSIDFSEISGRKQTGLTTGGYLAFSTRADLGNQTERMRIDSSGNVGIGTSSPATVLHVNGTTQLGGASQVLATYQDGAGISIEAFDPSDTVTKKNIWINAYGGNVGIGTAAPSEKLHVDGNVRISGGVALNGAPAADHTATGAQTNTFNAGYGNAVMDLVYLGGSSTWLEAGADAAGTSINMLGIALAAVSIGDALNVALPGSFVRDDTFNFTPGLPLYISNTLGAITATKPTGSGNIVRTVGYAMTADVIYFNPSSDYIILA